MYSEWIKKIKQIFSLHCWCQKKVFDFLVKFKQLTKNHLSSLVTAATKNFRPDLLYYRTKITENRIMCTIKDILLLVIALIKDILLPIIELIKDILFVIMDIIKNNILRIVNAAIKFIKQKFN